jgi:hypothetical protein
MERNSSLPHYEVKLQQKILLSRVHYGANQNIKAFNGKRRNKFNAT